MTPDSSKIVKDGTATLTRKDRPTNSIHFGDPDFEVPDEVADASWGEVYNACCVHSAEEWGMIVLGILAIAFFLYFFLFGLELLGTGAKVMTGCRAGALFGNDTNPIAGLMIGILATVLMQSSSTTTSIIVALTGSAVSVQQGIYMVMGANIGTSVTNTIVAIGQMGDGDQLERAFAGATVHDIFNFMTVGILLPVEVVTGYLDAFTGAMVKNAETEKGESWEGPVKKLVAPLADRIINDNSSVVKAIAKGSGSCEPGGGFYPIICEPGEPSDDTCSQVGLIKCDGDLGCPLFFDPDANAHDDKTSGAVCFFLGIVILFICLGGLVTVLQKMLNGVSTRIIYKSTNMNGYVAIAVGCGLTMLVQSSSITTSTLTPFVGIGAIRLEQMYPLTLGANIGTTMTGLMAALVTTGTAPLQVALAHLFFNVTGIVIFYPVPFMRRIPIGIARKLGKATRLWRGFPFLYIAIMFFMLPLLFLGLSSLYEQDSKGFTVLGVILTIFLAAIAGYTAFFCKYRNGQEKFLTCLKNREEKRLFMQDFPDEMRSLRRELEALKEHTGFTEEEAPSAAQIKMDDDESFAISESDA